MKGKVKRISSFILASALTIGLFSGCGKTDTSTAEGSAGTAAADSSAAASATAEGTKIDTSKQVQLQFYMIGDAPKDLDEINGKINEMTKKDLNATVKFNFTSWTDFGQKYNLVISSGQPVDLIYSASWLGYFKLANQGAFLPLDDLLPQYASDLYNFVPKDYWEQVKANGKIYTMPSTYKEYINNGFLYRKDLQKKYNLPEPNSIENVEAYLDGMKKNEPSQLLTNEIVFTGTSPDSFSAFEILSMKYKWVYFGTPYGLTADYDTPSDLKPYWGSPEFTEDMKMFKRWADKGFWSKSALSAKTDETAFANGKIIASMATVSASKYGDTLLKVKAAHPDWEVGYIQYPMVSGVAYTAHPAQNGFSIPASSENPERALMFYQKLVLDKNYNLLSQYGIEGKHYTVEDEHYVPVGDPAKSGFPREGLLGWAWRNPEFMLFDKSSDAVNEVFAKDAEIADKTAYKGTNIFDGFAEDFTSYQSERAALGTVMTQYLAPIEAGLVPDVEKAIATFMQKAKAAGLDKIQAEYTKQWKAYCAEHNYK